MSFGEPSKFRKYTPLVAVLFLLGGVVYAVRSLGVNTGYAPEQPIPFSHRLHAGENQIPCLYCHANADKGRHATVPSMNVCMNCHSVVANDKPTIQTLKKYYEEGRSIEWIRVHDLPDFVYFSHRWHVAKGVQCQTCHGKVEAMERIEQMQPLTMGWCVDCHRAKEASIECGTCHQ
ncbi:MAG: cytochrome c3 family protein [Deltaproteobacteria bacterium]|nr:cytochrome c3 family protein [Deltaproteobacteria bacterium]